MSTDDLSDSPCGGMPLQWTADTGEQPAHTWEEAALRQMPGHRQWEGEIRKYEAIDKRQPPPPHPALFIGGSTIRYWHKLPQAFPFLTLLNRGFGGATLADISHFADRILLPYSPSLIVLYAGENDLVFGMSPSAIINQTVALFHEITHAGIAVPWLLIGIKPGPARWGMREAMRATNAGLARVLADLPGVTFVDTFDAMLGTDGKPRTELYRGDGVHLSAAGYAVWETLLDPPLRDIIAPA